ncbi:glutaredoxin 3 [Paracoccus sp. TK19116]|uniref:Glutaredoxin n=1 Tax=Paracoccus albicereus TaxID=2922394 RepID=A0ABT1MRS3_9RHOB|nr:glutaredoxin 3 [Paracoccus albicereus]MCQ0970901.1 glutaredoxin 3 [Paracoccus albicereus]
MPEIEIYATRTCPFCVAARALLDRKSASYSVIDVGADPERRAEMMQRAGGRRTVPQIFIDGHHVGGNDDLQALDRAGKLDPMLRAAG